MTGADRPAADRLALRLAARLFVLEPGRVYRIGRDAESDLRVNHASVTDHHAGVSTAAGSVVIEDLSGGGVAVNGRRVRRAELRAGDRLQIGAIDIDVLPATAPPPAARGALASRHRSSPAFAELMAEELQRAPWLLLSVAIHAALLLLLWLWLRPPEAGTPDALQLSLTPGQEFGELEEADDEPTAIETEPLDLPLEEPEYLEVAPAETADVADAMPEQPREWLGSSADLFAKIRTARADDIMNADNDKLRAGGFGRTVSQLRRSGLEIVFVFDSTGSMSSALIAVKQRVAEMAQALHALVPESRIGVITYRDTGDDEEYLTRSTPLSRDFYRAINFIQVIGAGGGGDQPEAVYEALQEAFRQPWSPKARRVVVLIGDAPPHTGSQKNLRSKVERFAADDRSSIHAIVTSPDGDQRVRDETLRAFEAIARSGRGQCLPLGRDDGILGEVLSLAFGSEYRANIGEVFRILQERRERLSTRTLDLVRRHRADELARELSRTPIEADLVPALIASRDREVMRTLTQLAARPQLPASAHHAISYVLQQALGLLLPPIDPSAGGPMPTATQAAVLRLLER